MSTVSLWRPRLCAALVLSCVLTAGWAGPARADVFAATTSSLSVPAGCGCGLAGIAAADVNGDGRPDLVTTDVGRALSFFLNAGGGTFSSGPDFGGVDPFGLAVADLTGDGRPDPVFTEPADNQVVVLPADPTGLNYNNAFAIQTGNQPRGVAVGDLNGDGLPDIAVANFADDTLMLFLATGPGAYGTTPDFTLSTGHLPSSVAIGDLNGDGRPDLAVADQGNAATVTLFLKNAAAGFTTQTLSGAGGAPAAVAIGDLNGDGRPDLAVADSLNAAGGNSVTLFLKNATGSNYTPSTLATGAEPSSVVIGDFNGDGLPDIATADRSSNDVTVLVKDAAGPGYTPSMVAVGSGPVSLVAGDFTGDGKPDLATANTFDGNVTLLTQVPATAPAFVADTPGGGAVGEPYSYVFAASARPRAVFSVASGSLPDGLSLDSVSGALSGTPNAPGTYKFAVAATSPVGQATTPTVTIVVTGTAVAPAFTADTPPPVATESQQYEYQFAASGNPAPTFSLASGQPPLGMRGLTDAPGNGDLIGEFPNPTGTYTFTVRASNGVGPDAISPPITITVVGPGAPVFNDASPPVTGLVGAPYAYRFEASGGPPPSYAVASGALPSGLTLDPGHGVLAGVPTGGGTFTFTVSASNGTSPDAVTPSITITIPATPATPVFLADRPPGLVEDGNGRASYTFVASGNPAPMFAVASGSLPDGLSLDSHTGDLSGTPSSPGTATFAVKASNGVGADATTPPITIVTSGFTAAAPPATATIGVAYPGYTFAAAGHPVFYFGSGTPPDGLTLDGSTGVLAGTPTEAGAFTFTVVADYGGGIAPETQPITITVPQPPATAPAFTRDSPPTLATGGSPYSYLVAASGTPGPNFSVVAGGTLPPGLLLAASTGLLSGVPTQPGTFTFQLVASNGTAPDAMSPSITITITAGALAAPAFSADAPPGTATVGSPYAGYTFAASGNPAPGFAVASGALPDGLGLDATSGALSGTPTKAGTFTFTVSAANGVSPDSASGPLTITVSPAPQAPVFTAATPPGTATVGTAFSYAFAAAGYPAPRFTITSGALPAGLTLDAASGVLSGQPQAAGASNFTVGASNGVGQDATSGPLTITVSPALAPPVLTADAPPGGATVGGGYSYTFAASGYPAPGFAVASGSLPPGLALDPATGVLAGTPTHAGAATFTIRAANGVGPDAQGAAHTITVTAASVGPGPGTTPVPETKPKPAVKPSNIVILASAKAGSRGLISLKLKLPGSGRLLVTSAATIAAKKKHAKAKTIAYAARQSSARHGPATVTVAIKPAKAGSAALKAARTLRVTISVTFTPTGGTARTLKHTVTAR
jgi:hypothetical protein